MKNKGLSDGKQQKVSTYFYGTGDWKRNGKKSNKVDHLLVRLVIANDLSPCIIYNPELKELLPTPYIPPNSTDFYKTVKDKICANKNNSL